MNDTLAAHLDAFARQERIAGRGPLCVALVVTRRARRDGLPLDADSCLSKAQGQVAGLGKASVQAILKDHGIDRVLAEEGGRTSRGSVGLMRAYVEFLNTLHEEGLADLEYIEGWWVDQVRVFFAGKPFVLRLDASKSLRAAVRDLLDQAEKRQRESSGTMYVGTVIQHLVGAKLDLVLGGIVHHGASVADEGAGRAADFLVGDTAVHVTTSPSEALIRKCKANLAGGLRPVIVTAAAKTGIAQELANQGEIGERLDILDVEQFIAGNLYEHGRFELKGRRDATERLVEKYNEVVGRHEADPSLRINIGR